MKTRDLLRSLGFGRLAYRLLHRPFQRGHDREASMRRAAARLPDPAFPAAPAAWPAALFLTGRAFWHQTLFCADSFEHAARLAVPWEFHDDGTLGFAARYALRRRFPRARIVPLAETAARLEKHLPAARYPALYAARARHPLMRKLLDLRAGRAGPSLYLDSDMLFFSRPDELLRWLDSPQGNHHMLDALDSYFASHERVDALAGHPILRRLNSGLLALDATPLDWPTLEAFAARVGPAAAHRLFEQTLTALHATRVGSTPFPPERYRLLHEPLTAPPSGVLFHYCWHSKDAYFRDEWPRLLARHAATPASHVSR